MKFASLLFAVPLLWACQSADPQVESPVSPAVSDKIQVLNFGTFHFGNTNDAHTTSFDEHDTAMHREVRAIAERIAKFRPTIICVEFTPEKNEKLNARYQTFLENPDELDVRLGEVGMLAFEVGRLSHVPALYGIDHLLGYNYSVGDFIEESPDYENSIDPETYLELTNHPFKEHPELAEREAKYETLSLLEKLKFINEPLYLDQAIVSNAEKLMYVGIEDGFEGADNAALFYQRNMRIYSNLNRLKLKKNDRVFILMGAAHTAFLREFMERSPKFELVNTLDYLQ